MSIHIGTMAAAGFKLLSEGAAATAVCAIIHRRGREQRGRNNFITKVGVLQCSGFLVRDINFL